MRATLAALQRQVARLKDACVKTDAEPQVTVWLPQNGRGPDIDFRAGAGEVRFFDPAAPPAELYIDAEEARAT